MKRLVIGILAVFFVSSLAFAEEGKPVELKVPGQPERETASADYNKQYLEQVTQERQAEDAKSEQARARNEKLLRMYERHR